MNKSCLEQFSDLIDTMIEIEVDTSRGKLISAHQNRMHNHELTRKMIFELIDMLMEKADVVDEMMLKEVMTCECCMSLQLNNGTDQYLVNK